MRNAASHASILQRYCDLLGLQQMQLGSIQHNIADGNSRLHDQLKGLNSHPNATKGPQTHGPQTRVTRSFQERCKASKDKRSLRFRLPLMGWLAGRTWEIAVGQSQASWTLQIHPINFRPRESLAFRYVREGNITAIDRLIHAGELSIWDVTTTGVKRPTTLLGVRATPAPRLGNFDAAD